MSEASSRAWRTYPDPVWVLLVVLVLKRVLISLCHMPACIRMVTTGLMYPLRRILIPFAKVRNPFLPGLALIPVLLLPRPTWYAAEGGLLSFMCPLCGWPAVAPERLLSPCGVAVGGLTGPTWFLAWKGQLLKQVAMVTKSFPLHRSHRLHALFCVALSDTLFGYSSLGVCY